MSFSLTLLNPFHNFLHNPIQPIYDLIISKP